MPWDEQEAAFQGSDREFLLWLYQEFSRLMFYTAQKYLADPHSQEEVVQESLKKLIEKVAVLRRLKRPALAGYVRATVRNTAIDLLKVQGRERERVVGLEDLDGADGNTRPMCEPRSFRARVIAHNIDSDFCCCCGPIVTV